jgi:hypothetical protein
MSLSPLSAMTDRVTTSEDSIARTVDRRRPGSRACLAAMEAAAGQGDLSFCCRVGRVFNARLLLRRALNRPGFEPRCDRGAEERNRSPGTNAYLHADHLGAHGVRLGHHHAQWPAVDRQPLPVGGGHAGPDRLGSVSVDSSGQLGSALEARAVSPSNGGQGAGVCAYESADGIDGRPHHRIPGRAGSNALHRRLPSWNEANFAGNRERACAGPGIPVSESTGLKAGTVSPK